MLASFAPVLLALGAIAAIGAGLYYVFSDDEETPASKSKGSGPTAKLSNAVAPIANIGGSTPSVPTTPMSNFTGGGTPSINPSSSQMVSASGQSFTGDSTFVGPPTPAQQKVINLNQKIVVNEASDPRETARLIKRETAKAVQSSDTLAFS